MIKIDKSLGDFGESINLLRIIKSNFLLTKKGD